MRLRHITGSEDFVASHSAGTHEPEKQKGHWAELFGNTNPIHVEIGMGKGQFIRTISVRNPETNDIGLERFETVLMKAIQRTLLQDRGELSLPADVLRPNLRFLAVDAVRLPELFAPGEISRIFLNFSDPWPKKGHASRRLTSPVFFKLYDQILAPEGVVEFKTDNQGLFAWSLEAIPEAGWELLSVNEDLHASPEAADNVMTEYEEKFSGRGQKICKLVAARKRPAEG